MKKVSIAAAVILTAAALIIAAGCAKKKAAEKEFAPVPKGEALVIIGPHWEGVRKEFGDAFIGWYREKYKKDVKVEWLDQGGTGDDLRFLKSEFAKNPESTGVDLFYGGGVEPHLDLMKNGCLQSYRIAGENLKLIPKELSGVAVYDPQFNWYGACLAGFGIVYNKAVLKKMDFPEPRSWADLADPKVIGWVGSADPRHSGSIHMMYEIILQAYGWEKGFEVVTKMGGNIASFPKSASQTAKDVSAGQTAYGLAIGSYGWAQVLEFGEDKVGYMMPQGLTVINPDAISILKGAPHPELAKSFVDFVMSPAGQKLWMLKKGEAGGPKEFSLNRLSVMPHVYKEVEGKTFVRVNPFAWKGNFRYDSEKGGVRYTILNDLLGALIIDSHRELEKAWKAVIKGGMKEAAVEKLCEASCTEEELAAMAKDKWDDQAFRNGKLKEWIEFAKKKYKEAEKLSK